ncbi:MAG: redoxin domain-containing protein [Opitutaceae bacterium]|nr:redoxin domain-containing protein [Opitutaceae bacterium]
MTTTPSRRRSGSTTPPSSGTTARGMPRCSSPISAASRATPPATRSRPRTRSRRSTRSTCVAATSSSRASGAVTARISVSKSVSATSWTRSRRSPTRSSATTVASTAPTPWAEPTNSRSSSRSKSSVSSVCSVCTRRRAARPGGGSLSRPCLPFPITSSPRPSGPPRRKPRCDRNLPTFVRVLIRNLSPSARSPSILMKSLSLLALAGAALLASALCAQTPATVPASPDAPVQALPGPKDGDMAPDFTVIGPDGKEVKLSDFRGKLVLLDIWATWCGPCVASMPHNSELAEKFAKDGFVILAVCASDTRANYDGWVARNATKYKFLTAHDPAGKDWKESVFNTKYGVTGFPTLYLIGRDGRIVGRTAGGGAGENPYVTRLLAKGGLPIDTSHLPPERKDAPKSIPAVGKTMAMSAGTKSAAMIVPTMKLGPVSFGDAVADFAAVGIDGADVKLSAFKGKPVLITFWTGARAPADDVAKLAAAYKDQGLAVWAINVATERADFDTWAKANAAALGYTVSWDPAGKAFMESIAHMRFGAGMFPAYVALDAEGRFRGGIIGMGPKVAAWVRLSIDRAGIKLGAEDRAAVEATLREHFAANPPAGMAAATIQPKGNAGGMVAAQRVTTLGPGAVAPDFVAHDVTGKEVKLSDFKGQVVILDFWATWCGPCIASMPHTQKLAAAYKDQGVIVLASGTSDTIAKFKEWIPKNQPKYPDLRFTFDPNERGSATFNDRASSKHYGVTGIPTQFVIGRDGKIVATIVGNGGESDHRTEAALAKAGIKVDAARAAEGEKQLQAAAEEAAERAAAAAEELKNPKPQFRESYGKLKAGELVPDFTAEDSAGQPVKFSEVSKGKTVVLSFWGAGNGIADEGLALHEAWAKKYADQGVLFLGVGAYGSREDFKAWHAANAPKFSFPVLFDPAGPAPRPAKAFDEMTDDEKKAFQTLSREHYGKVIPMVFAGGAMAPIPNNVVVDAQGKFLGFYVGAGPGIVDSLGNLLLRAGIKLAPEDMPKKVFTAEESKEAPPEPRVEMLKIGTVAPDFVSQTLDGKDVKLSDFRGKVVILDFWATWCGPCLASMPHTQEVSAHYKDQGVVVLANCTSDTRKKFESWVKANQEKYPDIIWTHDKAERSPDRISRKVFGVGGIPTQFIIDREGKIVDIVIGYMKGEAILDAALAKAGVKVDPALIEKGAADLKKREMMR